MANQWHYNLYGQQLGPISDSELRKLANDGTLKTEDLIWKEGMAEWRKAGSMKGLFQKSTPPPIPPSPIVPTEPELVPSSPEKKAGASFGASAKLAGQLTAKKTELTKIQQVSLPGQYVVFGSQAFEEGMQRNEHKSLSAEIERLNNTISELEKSDANQPEAKTFTDKAMALGGKAVTTTKLKAAQLQRRQKFIHLGKSIFKSGKTPIGCESQKVEIDKLLARSGELQSEMADIKGTLTGHGREAAASGRSLLSSSAVVASLAILCAPIGLFLIWRHPTWEREKKLKWTGVSFACLMGYLLFGNLSGNPEQLTMQPSDSKSPTEIAVGEDVTSDKWGSGTSKDLIAQFEAAGIKSIKTLDKSQLQSDESHAEEIYTSPSKLKEDPEFLRILNGDTTFFPFEDSVDEYRAMELMAVRVYAQLMSGSGRQFRADQKVIETLMKSSAMTLGCQRSGSMRYLMEIEPNSQFQQNGFSVMQYGRVSFRFREHAHLVVAIIDGVMINGNLYSTGNR